MIIDNIKNLKNYTCLDSRLTRALEIIRETNFEALEDKTYEVDGRDLFFFIQTYDTQAINETPEAHRSYIDIQYMIFGTERMDVGQLEDMTEEVSANPQKDIWFYRGPTDSITLSPGMFAVFFPNDAHAPNISPAAGINQVRKCVFKVHT